MTYIPLHEHRLDTLSKYSPYVDRVYMHIVRVSIESGLCTDSVPNMAKRLNISIGSVKNALSTLINEGMITRESQKGTTSIYRLVEECLIRQCTERSIQVFIPFMRVMNTSDAIILSYMIHYYAKKGLVLRDGLLWIPKGYADWKDDTGLNEFTARNSIKRLKANGFIDTRIYQFVGTPTLHTRPVLDQVQKFFYEDHWTQATNKAQ